MGAQAMAAMNKVLEAKVAELQSKLAEVQEAQARATGAAPGLRSLLSSTVRLSVTPRSGCCAVCTHNVVFTLLFVLPALWFPRKTASTQACTCLCQTQRRVACALVREHFRAVA
mgnify:CR=1 FL=1